MPRPSEQQWAVARARWENDPKVTFADLAPIIGTSKQSVAKRAQKESWERKITREQMADAAHKVADIRIARDKKSLSRKTLKNKPRVVPSEDAFEDEPPPTPDEIIEQAEALGVDQRATLLKKHRDEWNYVRELVKDARREKSNDKAKTAKVVAEATKIVQDGERKAWGLDVAEAPTGEMRVIIEREDAVKKIL